MSSRAPLRIAMRASDVAARSGRLVQSLLQERGVASELVTIRTKGDRKRNPVQPDMVFPGLFTREIETAIAKGKVDCGVHALKDLPFELRDGLSIAAVLERRDPRDVVIVNPVAEADSLASLPSGSRIGVSNARRRAQLLALRPDLEPAELRGDVTARLSKVEKGRVHAAILSAESLHLLGVHRITEFLEAPDWLPAAAQGALAVEIRGDDDEARATFAFLNHEPTAIATRAERAFVDALESGPHLAVAVLAMSGTDGALPLHAFVSDEHARNPVRGSRPVDPRDPEQSGRDLAAELRHLGVESLILELRNRGEADTPF